MPRNKYNAKKCEIDGIKFDSMKEARHYRRLKLLQRAGRISELKCHPSFDLKVNGALVCKYVADFSYVENSKTVICDVKGMKSGGAWQVFRIKAKLFKAVYGIDVIVV